MPLYQVALTALLGRGGDNVDKENLTRSTNVGLMLDKHHRRWSNIDQAGAESLMFARAVVDYF